MAEKIYLPGTLMEVVEKYPGSYRLDHPDFGDVTKTTFAKGTITDFGLAKDAPKGGIDPFTLDGTCTVEVDGKSTADIPIFYHCREGMPEAQPAPEPIEFPPGWEWINDLIPSLTETQEQDDGAGILEANGTLRRGPWAYHKGQEVKVLLQGRKAKCVVGHMPRLPGNEPKVPNTSAIPDWETPEVTSTPVDPPYKCHNIFQVRTWDWMSGVGYGIPVGKGTEQNQGFMYSLRRTYGNYNEKKLKDQYNKDLNLKLTRKAYRLFGYREFQRGTIILFYGDWLIKLGPAMFIFQVKSIGWPGPTTSVITILAAIYDKGLEQQTIAIGKKKETMYPPVIGGSVPFYGPFEFESVKYDDRFIKQTDFSNYMLGYYQGINGAFGGDTPRWVYAEIYTEPMGYME